MPAEVRQDGPRLPHRSPGMVAMSARDIYLSFFMFTVNLHPDDPQHTEVIVRHMEKLRSFGYTGFDMPVFPNDTGDPQGGRTPLRKAQGSPRHGRPGGGGSDHQRDHDAGLRFHVADRCGTRGSPRLPQVTVDITGPCAAPSWRAPCCSRTTSSPHSTASRCGVTHCRTGCGAQERRASSAAPAGSGREPGSMTSRPRRAPGLLRRVEVETDDVAGLGDEQRVAVDGLNVWARCGARASARQIREMVDCDMPVAAAIDLVDQPVALFGVSSSVLTMTRSTSASVIFRGTPGRGRHTSRPGPVRGSGAAWCGPCPASTQVTSAETSKVGPVLEGLGEQPDR